MHDQEIRDMWDKISELTLRIDSSFCRIGAIETRVDEVELAESRNDERFISLLNLEAKRIDSANSKIEELIKDKARVSGTDIISAFSALEARISDRVDSEISRLDKNFAEEINKIKPPHQFSWDKVKSLIDEVYGCRNQVLWTDMGIHKKFDIIAKRLDELDEIHSPKAKKEDQEHLQQILIDKQQAGMLRVKELEIRDNMVERSMLLEKIKDLEIKLRNSNRDLEIEKQAAEALKAQPRINHEELERRLDSISQILFCYTEGSKKKNLVRGIGISAAAIGLLIRDIQFPIRDKDIFKPCPGRKFIEGEIEAGDGEDDELADYESEGYYSEYEEDEDDLG